MRPSERRTRITVVCGEQHSIVYLNGGFLRKTSDDVVSRECIAALLREFGILSKDGFSRAFDLRVRRLRSGSPKYLNVSSYSLDDFI